MAKKARRHKEEQFGETDEHKITGQSKRNSPPSSKTIQNINPNGIRERTVIRPIKNVNIAPLKIVVEDWV